MGAGLIQLSAIGPQDFHLTANPQITFFKTVYKRHTNFSKEVKQIFFMGESKPGFGSKDLRAIIRNEGDLVGKIFLEIQVTGTCSAKTYTVSNFSNSLLEKVVCKIGSDTIDTQYGRFYQILDELEGNYDYNTQNKSSTTYGGLYTNIDRDDADSQSYENITPVNKMLGNYALTFGGTHNGETDSTGTYTKRFYIPLRFWFNNSEGMYLPLVSLFKHQVDLYFDFASKSYVIGDSTNISSESFTMTPKLYGEFYYLDKNEKTRFAQSNHEYIIEQHQLNNSGRDIVTTSNDSTTELSQMNIELNFSHPVKYLAWVIVNEGTRGNNKGVGPCYFTSLTESSLYGNDGMSGKVEIQLEGVTREIQMPMTYYTRVIPYNYFKRVPLLDRIGVYSFALNPLDGEPSGTCNFSKLYDKTLKINFANNQQAVISGKELYVYAVSYNVLTITNGMAQVRYT
jgi:hypothetical protein